MTRSCSFAAVVLLLLLLPMKALAQGQLTQEEREQIEAGLDGLVNGIEPGIAVGIVRDGAVVYERYIGYANLEHKIENGPRTRFNIASNAKQFTALMVLEMSDQGLVDLDTDFRNYLPQALPLIQQEITVRELITHKSGIRDIYDLWSLTGLVWYEEALDTGDAMELLNRQEDLNFTPGTEHLYSNSNYILLAEMISGISGEAYHEYVDAFFSRLGMEDTGVRRRYGVIVPDLARAYGQWDGWLEDPAIANLHGDGFLFTTLTDQLAWESQVQGAPSSLSPELIELSQQPMPEVTITDYGYGLERGEYKGLPYTYHVGSTGGYNAYLMRFPEEELSIVVLGNTTQIGVVGTGWKIADILLADMLVDEVYPAGPATIGTMPAREVVLGRYEIDSGTIITISEKDGALYREIERRDPVRLIPEEGNVYFYETVPDLKIVFTQSENGGAEFSLYLASQAPQTAVKLEEVPASMAYFTSFEGKFRNAETDTLISIVHEGGEVFGLFENGRSREAKLMARDVIAMNSYRFRAIRSEDGIVTGFLADNNRIRNVRFERIE